MIRGQTKIIPLSRFVYKHLMAFYSREFRCRFEAEMVEDFEQLLRDEIEQRGSAGVAALWSSALWELLTVAAPSRLVSRTAIAGALSFLTSSVLFLVFFRAVT